MWDPGPAGLHGPRPTSPNWAGLVTGGQPAAHGPLTGPATGSFSLLGNVRVGGQTEHCGAHERGEEGNRCSDSGGPLHLWYFLLNKPSQPPACGFACLNYGALRLFSFSL